MIYLDKITKKSDLENNDSLTVYDNKWSAQQNYKAFETFFYFLKETRPNKILEVGTSQGGFTYFLKKSCEELNLNCDIISLDINEFPWYKELIDVGVDLRIENVFNDDYTEVKDNIKDFIMSDGTTIVLCDGGNKKNEFNLLSKFLKDGDFILAHDYSVDYNFFIEKINKKIWNWFEIEEKDIIDACHNNSLVDYRRDLFQEIVWVCKMKINDSNITKKI